MYYSMHQRKVQTQKCAKQSSALDAFSCAVTVKFLIVIDTLSSFTGN